MVRLRSWCRSQFHRADYQAPMDNFDALAILDQNARNVSGMDLDKRTHYDPCHFFAIFFCSVANSVGYTPRLLSINNHGITELWSNEFNKWVMMDTEFNHHFEKNGIPMSAAELVDESLNETHDCVEMKRGTQTSDVNPAMVHLKLDRLEVRQVLDWFQTNVDLVDMRNDWMTNHYFRGHPARGITNSLVYSHPKVRVPLRLDQRLRLQTRDSDEFCWTLNQTEIQVRSFSSVEGMAVGFKTITPNFKHFEIWENGKPSQRSDTATFQWHVTRGVNRLTVRAVNQFGVAGALSEVHLQMP
jgi:hypothetical protein